METFQLIFGGQTLLQGAMKDHTLFLKTCKPSKSLVQTLNVSVLNVITPKSLQVGFWGLLQERYLLYGF